MRFRVTPHLSSRRGDFEQMVGYMELIPKRHFKRMALGSS